MHFFVSTAFLQFLWCLHFFSLLAVLAAENIPFAFFQATGYFLAAIKTAGK